jgi:hypothetical protein
VNFGMTGGRDEEGRMEAGVRLKKGVVVARVGGDGVERGQEASGPEGEMTTGTG